MPSPGHASPGEAVDLAACRRPDKRTFDSEEAVWAWLRAHPALRQAGNTPYRCPGGHWHYGHARPKGRRKDHPR